MSALESSSKKPCQWHGSTGMPIAPNTGSLAPASRRYARYNRSLPCVHSASKVAHIREAGLLEDLQGLPTPVPTTAINDDRLVGVKLIHALGQLVYGNQRIRAGNTRRLRFGQRADIKQEGRIGLLKDRRQFTAGDVRILARGTRHIWTTSGSAAATDQYQPPCYDKEDQL